MSNFEEYGAFNPSKVDTFAVCFEVSVKIIEPSSSCVDMDETGLLRGVSSVSTLFAKISVLAYKPEMVSL